MDDFELTQPTPDEIRALVQESGLSRSTAAELVHASRRTWDKWTTRADSNDNRPMPIAVWELFLIKTGNHPSYKSSD